MKKIFFIDSIKWSDKNQTAKSEAIYKKYPDCYRIDYNTDPVAGYSEYFEGLSDFDDLKQMLAEYDEAHFSMSIYPTVINYDPDSRSFTHEH